MMSIGYFECRNEEFMFFLAKCIWFGKHNFKYKSLFDLINAFDIGPRSNSDTITLFYDFCCALYVLAKYHKLGMHYREAT